MMLKRRRALEVPPKIKFFINSVTSTPVENIQEPLKYFSWEFDKGDFHHWVDLFNHFDTFFEKYIKPRKDLQLKDNFVDCDPPFPRHAVLQILRVIRIILENCTNKHFYSSFEHHISSLLACTDTDVLEACLQTLAAFLKKSIGKYIIRDASLNSRLFCFAQGWGGKEEGVGLVSCAPQNGSDKVALDLGSTLHFEFYAVNEYSTEITCGDQRTQGLQIIHIPDVNGRKESDLELLNKLIVEYKVPCDLRFFLLTRLRFARAFSSMAARQQYTCVRLYAFVVLVQACGAVDNLVSFFNSEPEFINELVTLLRFEDAVPEKIRILSLLSLVALCQDRSRQPTVLTAVTSGGHRGILSSLMQKAINSVVHKSSTFSIDFAEALLSLVTVLVSSSSGCSAMREAGFIPTLLPLLKDSNPQHLHLVTTAVQVLEAFMDYSNPAAALFRDLGGLDNTISRLMIEVSYIENGSKQQSIFYHNSSECADPQVVKDTSAELDSQQRLYSETSISYHRRLLMKALLRAISLGTYAPGTTARVYGSEESLLPHCLCIIFKRSKDFGGGVFSLAATVMSDLIHKDPTCFSVLESAGLPSAFMDAITDGVLCSAGAISCIPQCLDALCLNNSGLQAVKERNALRCFVKVFTSKMYLRALASDTPSSLSSGLDELMRHASLLRGPGVDMLIEILNQIAKIGSGLESASLTTVSPSSSQSVPMEIESENRNLVLSNDRAESCEQSNDLNPDAAVMNVESFLPDCISNFARLLETILQNSETCRIFIEKKGIEGILQLFTLPLLPLSVSLGQSIAVAFKNFSPQHSVSLAHAVCSFLREHLKYTDELLTSIGGTQLAQLEISKQAKVLRCLSCLDGILTLSNSFLKGTTSIVSELSSTDADVWKDLGKAYREILWQVSLCYDLKVEEKRNSGVEPGNADTGPSNVSARESDEDASSASNVHMDHVSIRNNFHSQLTMQRDFMALVRSSDGFIRRGRHNSARLQSGRTRRHLEAFHINSEVGANNAETHEMKKKSPEILVSDNLKKLALTMRSFFTALVKGFTSPHRRRTETGSLSSASKNIGTGLAKIFLEALGFSGYSNPVAVDMSLSVKCRYLGKVVDDMVVVTFDIRRRTCYTAMINNFYVHGTFKELLTTFEATSQLLWTHPHAISMSGAELEKGVEGSKLAHSSWLLATLQSHCRELEYFVNSGLLLSSTSTSQTQLLVQPVAVGLSIGLFPVPREPDAFVRLLQSQVLDVILSVLNNPMFPSCSPGFISSIISLITHVYNGVGDVKRSQNGLSGRASQRFMRPTPDEATIATIVEMGFSRARAEEALRRVETNSVEMAMEWLFSHAEDSVQDDDELARALALSLGSSSEAPKDNNVDKSADVLTEERQIKAPSADEILAAAMKLLQGSDSLAFPLTDLLVTLCSRNKGEDCSKVVSYLVQQLKLCPLEFSKDNSALGVISHTVALLLSEDGSTRETAAQNGVVLIAIDILMNFMVMNNSLNELFVPKCISSLLLILDCLVQPRLKIPADAANEGTASQPLTGSSENQAPSEEMEENLIPAAVDKDALGKECSAFESILGKSTGYLTMEESHKVLIIACDLIKRHVSPMVMQAVFQLCARLTISHVLALQFLEIGGLFALFGIPRSCIFPGYETLASAIVRHLLEDPQTLQTTMESEIRKILSGSFHAGRMSARKFLTSLAHVVIRDPGVFMRAVAAVCQLEASGGRYDVVLSKDKEKDKLKASDNETRVSVNECVRITESKAPDGSSKYSKGHKKIPPNLTQVIDYLLEIVSEYPSYTAEDHYTGHSSAMEVDDLNTKLKGKSKVVDETMKLGSDSPLEKSSDLAKVTFVLKLLSDILLMYAHASGVILRRDLELSQSHGSSRYECPGRRGIVHHVLHILLPVSIDKAAGTDECRDKLSEKVSWFLVVLAGRSSEGRRRVVNELVKALSSFVNVENNSSNRGILPDKKVLSVVNLVYSILSKNSSSGNLPGSGSSPDIARSMIDGGIVHCLSSILQVIDFDHPNAPKTVNPILKSLESLTRAANASEQLLRADTVNKKNITGPSGGSDALLVGSSASQELRSTVNRSRDELTGIVGSEAQPRHIVQNEGDQNADSNQFPEQNMMIGEAPTAIPLVDLGVNYMHDAVEESGALPDTQQMEMAFHVENGEIDDINDEEDEMVDDGDDDDDEGEDEDEDIAEDGTGLMSLGDTDVEDQEDTGLGDEYNDDMVDEDDDDFHENRVIEVRWREALDGLDHLQVLGQPETSGGLIDVSAEPFEGVNVDDFFGIRRSFGFERRRQANRTSNEQSTRGNVLQHPLLSRPSHSGDLVSIWTSGGNLSREYGLSAGNTDVSHFNMFDEPPLLPYDNTSTNMFGNQHGGSLPPPLADFSVGLESLRVSGRRGPGDGRWTGSGQLQAGGQAAAIAQAVEEQFISQLRNNNPAEMLSQNPVVPEREAVSPTMVIDNQATVGADGTDTQQNDDLPYNNENQANQLSDLQSRELNLGVVAEQEGEVGHDSMETGEGNSGREPLETYSGSVAQGDGSGSFDRASDDLVISSTLPSQDDGFSRTPVTNSESSGHACLVSGSDMTDPSDNNFSSVPESNDVDMTVVEGEGDPSGPRLPLSDINIGEPSSQQNNAVVQSAAQIEESSLNNESSNTNGIDPAFLEALLDDLRAEVLASQQAQTAPAPQYVPPAAEDIDPEFLAALPPDIQAEVLAQQRAQRIAHLSEGQPVDMDNASIIATFPAELREEVLLTSSEAVLSALPSQLLAEAQMLRDRAMSQYHARSLTGSTQRLGTRGNRLGFVQTMMDRAVGVTIGRKASSVIENLKLTEHEGEPLLDADGLKALVRLLRLARPLGKGLLQRLLLNLCSHSDTRAILVHLLLDMIKPKTVGRIGGLTSMNTLRLYGCQSNVVYGRSQLCDGVPPLVLRRVLEILTYLATNHSGVSSSLFHFEASKVLESVNINHSEAKNDKDKDKIIGEEHHRSLSGSSKIEEVPLILLLKLLSRPLLLQSAAHLEQVMDLLQVVVYAAASKVDIQSDTKETAVHAEEPSSNGTPSDVQEDPHVVEAAPNQLDQSSSALYSKADGQRSTKTYDIFLQLPQSDLHNLCDLLGHEGLSDKVYTLAGEMLRKLASVAVAHRKYFVSELSELAQSLSSSAVNEILTLKDTLMVGLSAGSMTGAAVLRVLQILSSLASIGTDSNKDRVDEEEQEEHATMWKLNVSLEPLWKELSECISSMESMLGQSSQVSVLPNINTEEQIQGSSSSSPPLPPGTQRLLPFIEGFFVLCEKLQAHNPILQQDHSSVTAREVKESIGTSVQSSNLYVDSHRRLDGSVTFTKFSEKHRRLLNAFVRQNPCLLENSLSMLLTAPRLIDFDNKKVYFRSRIRQQHDQHLSGPLRISVRRAYILEDSYNQLRMRPTQDLKGRLNVHFQGEEGIDAGGLTREWYQVLSRVVFDKGALLFTTVGNNATFQPNPNSVYQNEHLSYFRFVGRVVAKALFDGQLLDVYFTRSFYKHMLGVKVTYHDIEAVDPDYYKNLKWMLENDVSDIPDLTFSMDADAEKHILYEKTEVTDHELKPGGRNIRVTEETKHEYVDLVADHILTNAIRSQINSFLEGFSELVPTELISIFNGKELELLISGLPEINYDDLKANTEYSGYTAASNVVQWCWEVVKGFNKEDMARFLQFVTGTSKVPLEGFKALQGISGPQKFHIYKAYGAPERLPSAHTCFNQLDLPEYSSKEQLQERLLLAIHEASEGFGFG